MCFFTTLFHEKVTSALKLYPLLRAQSAHLTTHGILKGFSLCSEGVGMQP